MAKVNVHETPPEEVRSMSRERAREPVHEAHSFDTYELNDAYNTDDRPWERPSSLVAPTARPGFGQHWVRVSMRNEEDTTNSARRFREGWKARAASTVPPTYQVPTTAHGRWAGAIMVEGMLLCEMPLPMIEKRRKFFAAETARITDAIESELQSQSRPGMEISQQRSSRVVREVKPMADENA